MELLQKALEMVGGLEGMVAGLAIAVELVFRFIPTEKPKSFIYAAAAIVKGLGVLFTKVGELSDKILPQKVKSQELL